MSRDNREIGEKSNQEDVYVRDFYFEQFIFERGNCLSEDTNFTNRILFTKLDENSSWNFFLAFLFRLLMEYLSKLLKRKRRSKKRPLNRIRYFHLYEMFGQRFIVNSVRDSGGFTTMTSWKE